jgi:hypothetical protein
MPGPPSASIPGAEYRQAAGAGPVPGPSQPQLGVAPRVHAWVHAGTGMPGSVDSSVEQSPAQNSGPPSTQGEHGEPMGRPDAVRRAQAGLGLQLCLSAVVAAL